MTEINMKHESLNTYFSSLKNIRNDFFVLTEHTHKELGKIKANYEKNIRKTEEKYKDDQVNKKNQFELEKTSTGFKYKNEIEENEKKWTQRKTLLKNTFDKNNAKVKRILFDDVNSIKKKKDALTKQLKAEAGKIEAESKKNLWMFGIVAAVLLEFILIVTFFGNFDLHWIAITLEVLALIIIVLSFAMVTDGFTMDDDDDMDGFLIATGVIVTIGIYVLTPVFIWIYSWFENYNGSYTISAITLFVTIPCNIVLPPLIKYFISERLKVQTYSNILKLPLRFKTRIQKLAKEEELKRDEANSILKRKKSEAEEVYEKGLKTINKEFDTIKTKIENEYKPLPQEINADYNNTVNKLKNWLVNTTSKFEKTYKLEINKLETHLANSLEDWKKYIKKGEMEQLNNYPETFDSDNLSWNTLSSTDKKVAIPFVRFGHLKLSTQYSQQTITLPDIHPFVNLTNLLFKCNDNQSIKMASKISYNALSRMLLAVPAGKVKFLFFDPVGLGQNISPFLALNEDLYGKKVWVEPNHIEEHVTRK